MTSSRTTILAGVVAALTLTGVAAVAAGTAVADRQAAMKAMGGSMKAASGLMTPTTFNAAQAKTAMDALAADAEKLKGLFPADSLSDPKTAADPKIGQNRADFDKRLDALAAAATTAGEAKDADGFKAALRPMGDICRSCHQVYRMRKPA